MLASGCSDAVAATKTTKASVKSKTTAKRKTPARATTTVKRTTSTVLPTTRPATSLVPKLSAEAQAVLVGYESYLVVFAAAAREPERAEAILPKGVTGDALDRLIEIARYDISQGQYWDGTRAYIISKPRVQSIGESRATIRDCQSVGGVLRKRATNNVVSGSTEPDIDDLCRGSGEDRRSVGRDANGSHQHGGREEHVCRSILTANDQSAGDNSSMARRTTSRTSSTRYRTACAIWPLPATPTTSKMTLLV